jgi:hypothetical protein
MASASAFIVITCSAALCFAGLRLIRRRRGVGWLVGGGPAGEEPESVVGGRARLGAEDDQGQARVGGQLHHVVGKVHVADDGVPEVLEPGAVQLNVVGAPTDAEFVAAGGQLSYEADQVLVVGVAAGFGRKALTSSRLSTPPG